jgi:sialate O-acetylesterase
MIIVLLLACTATDAPFAFSKTLGDHAVLQNPIVIWGTGAPGSEVTTVVNASAGAAAATAPGAAAAPGTSLETKVGADGIWRQPLGAMATGLAAYTITSTITSRTSSGDLDADADTDAPIVLKDVLVGVTFLCSGQSNIDLVSVAKALNATAELAACETGWPHVRLLKTAGAASWGGPQPDLTAAPAIPWSSFPDRAGCAAASATCFFAARDLFEALGGGTPVGAVQSAVGGTALRQWVPTEGLARCSQPWAGLMHYGAGPYAASTHYNAMIAPFGTGPTAFSFVLWDQVQLCYSCLATDQ